MKINQAGLELIKTFEGCKLTVYKDAVGLPTVGYGHMDRDLRVGDHITQEEANRLLAVDLERFEKGVAGLIKNAHINDNEFSACVAFAFNVGLGNFKSSLLLRCINSFNMKDAAAQFDRWCHADGRILQGLVRRREAERALFLS